MADPSKRPLSGRKDEWLEHDVSKGDGDAASAAEPDPPEPPVSSVQDPVPPSEPEDVEEVIRPEDDVEEYWQEE